MRPPTDLCFIQWARQPTTAALQCSSQSNEWGRAFGSSLIEVHTHSLPCCSLLRRRRRARLAHTGTVCGPTGAPPCACLCMWEGEGEARGESPGSFGGAQGGGAGNESAAHVWGVLAVVGSPTAPTENDSRRPAHTSCLAQILDRRSMHRLAGSKARRSDPFSVLHSIDCLPLRRVESIGSSIDLRRANLVSRV